MTHLADAGHVAQSVVSSTRLRELFGRLIGNTPSAADAGVWEVASRAALAFWQALVKESALSTSFRRIARGNVLRVEAFRAVAQRLPS